MSTLCALRPQGEPLCAGGGVTRLLLPLLVIWWRLQQLLLPVGPGHQLLPTLCLRTWLGLANDVERCRPCLPPLALCRLYERTEPSSLYPPAG